MLYRLQIKELRVKKGLTQTEISDIINVSQTNYSKYELGKIEPSLDVLVKLANLYDVSIDKLIGRVH